MVSNSSQSPPELPDVEGQSLTPPNHYGSGRSRSVPIPPPSLEYNRLSVSTSNSGSYQDSAGGFPDRSSLTYPTVNLQPTPSTHPVNSGIRPPGHGYDALFTEHHYFQPQVARSVSAQYMHPEQQVAPGYSHQQNYAHGSVSQATSNQVFPPLGQLTSRYPPTPYPPGPSHWSPQAGRNLTPSPSSISMRNLPSPDTGQASQRSSASPPLSRTSSQLNSPVEGGQPSWQQGQPVPLDESKPVEAGNRRHQCDVCLKRFPRPSALRTHMNSHTKAQPYRCPDPTCGKTFSVSSNAKRHFRTHGGDPATMTRSQFSVATNPNEYIFNPPTIGPISPLDHMGSRHGQRGVRWSVNPARQPRRAGSKSTDSESDQPNQSRSHSKKDRRGDPGHP